MSKGKIMIVDDSPTVLNITSNRLRRAGYDVVSGSHEKSLLEISSEKPDLLLLDVAMPGLSGDKIARILKGTGIMKHGVVVFFSSLPVAELEEMVRVSGASGYLRKSQEGPEFLQEVEFWMQKARAKIPV